ncbi:hypothetical protein PoB_003620300 [Plakobranchus ocellatus]|uniref:Uncharacterized protein n=1 Tax=Plakobranchus ocellatus TaxID=259542 RepID=A0AAV4AQR9_9GAST|nr:hypothetical protein PoB_003620300 [Plakobranchus ocellatus]
MHAVCVTCVRLPDRCCMVFILSCSRIHMKLNMVIDKTFCHLCNLSVWNSLNKVVNPLSRQQNQQQQQQRQEQQHQQEQENNNNCSNKNNHDNSKNNNDDDDDDDDDNNNSSNNNSNNNNNNNNKNGHNVDNYQ